jgi:hypothetical protein
VRQNLVSVFILLYLAVHVWTAVRGVENFPLSAAVMFSRDIGPDRPLYTLLWRITDRGGARSEAEPRRLGLHPRHFFLHVYQPDLADSPYHGRHRPPDSPAAFEARMSAWFGVFAQRWSARSGTPSRQIDLVLRPHAATEGPERLLGSFTTADGRFRLPAQADRAVP